MNNTNNLKSNQSDINMDHSITLRGSADMVTEFFAYGVNTLLYQRGIYPPESFNRISKYGMTMLVSNDEDVQKYMSSVLDQMKIWLERSSLQRVVVVIASVATKKVLERWAFDVGETNDEESDPLQNVTNVNRIRGKKENSKIVGEIQAVVRQITASVSFLPLLDEACSFDMLIYTKQDIETPTKWEESGPRTINNSEQVTLRSFSTSVHNVDASVTYARDQDD